MDEALNQHLKWKEKGIDISISINISAKQFLDKNFVPRFIKKLKDRNCVTFSKLNKENIKTKEMTELIFNELLELQNKAIKYAKKLLENYADSHNPESDNPSTRVFELVEILNKNNEDVNE